MGKIYIRSPWAQLIVEGQKTIETAAFNLPQRFAGQWLQVQTEGQQIIGRVKFKGSKRYTSAQEFNSDSAAHRVGPGSAFHYQNRKRCFAWVVSQVVAFKAPRRAKPFKSQFRLEH